MIVLADSFLTNLKFKSSSTLHYISLFMFQLAGLFVDEELCLPGNWTVKHFVVHREIKYHNNQLLAGTEMRNTKHCLCHVILGSDEDNSNTNAVIIVASILTPLLVISLIIVAVFYVCRRHRQRKEIALQSKIAQYNEMRMYSNEPPDVNYDDMKLEVCLHRGRFGDVSVPFDTLLRERFLLRYWLYFVGMCNNKIVTSEAVTNDFGDTRHQQLAYLFASNSAHTIADKGHACSTVAHTYTIV